MYCRRCGRKMEYDGDICNECNSFDGFFEAPKQETPQVTYAQPTYYQPARPAQQGSVMEGFGKALAATIMSVVALGFLVAALELFIMGGFYEEMLGSCVVIFMIALGLSIPSLIMGISSIKLFKEQKDLGRKKPIPALVLGISSVVDSAIVLLYAALFLMIFMGAGI